MSIAKFVEDSICKNSYKEHELAFASACIASAATSNLEYPEIKDNDNKKYKKFIEDNMLLITSPLNIYSPVFKMRGIVHPELVRFNKLRDSEGLVELKDIMYHVLRCGLLHAATVEDFIVFSEDWWGVQNDKWIIPEAFCRGLLFAVVLNKKNSCQKIGRPCTITIQKNIYNIDDIWGQKDKFIKENT